MAYTAYVPVIGVILNITRGNNCCSQMMSLRTDNGIVNFAVGPDTRVIDSRPLRAGLRVAAFYDSSLPAPLIFPPQYQAQIVTVLARNQQVTLREFDRNLVARDNSLQLNIARNTRIETINGQNTTCNLGNQTLLVYYTTTTRSIPPQTTPERIVALC
ncbi:MAG: hypothetical protein NC318_01350 [Blautia sp.]|nr:hypothetical protein [Lachnoclostridium sp.]MCM1210228.1 hypothetical protein [Blautia sp.]